MTYQYNSPIHPWDLPWWGWLLSAVAFWLAQAIVSALTLTSHQLKVTPGPWIVRGALIAAMLLCAVFGIIRLLK